jgi:AAA15 family ATPase/GTPase
MELLKIQNFAGIRELEFEFKPITVLIGPQASGKSVSIKLLYFIKSYISGIVESITDGETQPEYDRRQKEKFCNYFPRESWPDGEFTVTYANNDAEIKMVGRKSSLDIIASANFISAIDYLRKSYHDEKESLLEKDRLVSLKSRFLLEDLIRSHFLDRFSPTVINRHFFIPAGRSFFANIQKSIFSFLSDNRQLDPFLVEFGSFYEDFKELYNKHENTKTNNTITKNILSILDGEYVREENKDYLIHADRRRVNLSNASSGQQEMLPLLVTLGVITSVLPHGGATIYIEEPEAHLFPAAQKRIVQLLAKVFNHNGSHFQIIVTTHSPYILASFNNLLEAGQFSRIEPEKADLIAHVIPKEEQIHPDSFAAYSLNNGRGQTIIDAETKLVSQTLLDDTSNEIAKEFGKLLDIEF